LDVARTLGAAVAEPRLEYFPTPEDKAWAGALIDRLKGAGAQTIVTIHPGGGINPGVSFQAKRWYPAGFATIANRLLEEGAGVVLVGDTSDPALTELVLDAIGDLSEERSARLRVLEDGTSLGRLGAVIQSGDLFLGNDSGPLHLSVAVGTPVVGIYGPTSPASYGPFDESSQVVYKGASCSPCFGGDASPVDDCDLRCIEKITPEDVWGKVRLFLEDKT
jgi:ADP-heptose:LPS heptosyltransferase